jgi:hypothetical protein
MVVRFVYLIMPLEGISTSLTPSKQQPPNVLQKICRAEENWIKKQKDQKETSPSFRLFTSRQSARLI